MTKAKGHILPFFIPHLGCPQKCIFCDQRTISGRSKLPTAAEIANSMAENKDKNCQLAFYGGSFTAMPEEKQLYYLQVAKAGLDAGFISGVRISTRPDCIDEETIERLKQYGVDTVELGVQSLNDETLQLAKRGHDAAAALQSVRLLKKCGLTVGVQLMPGLPGEDEKSIIYGAKKILAGKPHLLRIYPAVVVKNTEMAAMYQRGDYVPLSLEKAVELSAKITLWAAYYGVNVIRTGLNTDEHLAEEVLAGPYHPAFGHLVKSYIWRQKVLWAIAEFGIINPNDEIAEVFADKSCLPMVFGQNSTNKEYYRKAATNDRLRIRGFNEKFSGGKDDIIVVGKDGGVCRRSSEDFLQYFVGKPY